MTEWSSYIKFSNWQNYIITYKNLSITCSGSLEGFGQHDALRSPIKFPKNTNTATWVDDNV